MTIRWQDPDEWGSWPQCGWSPDFDDWVCLLPVGHFGPHVAPLSMEADPADSHYFSRDDEWVETKVLGCPVPTCRGGHPGFRHATNNDPVVIRYHHKEDAWGPAPNRSFPDGIEISLVEYVPTFVDGFPTPPKFATIEEADAWLEANPPL